MKANTTASLILGAVLEKMGFLEVSLSPDQLINQLVIEDYEENFPTASAGGEASDENMEQVSEQALEDDDFLSQLVAGQSDLDEAELNNEGLRYSPGHR